MMSTPLVASQTETTAELRLQLDLRRRCFGNVGKRAPVDGATLAAYNMHELGGKVNIGK